MIATDLFLLNSALIAQELLATLPELLSADEHHIWHQMSHNLRRQEYLVSRALLRQLLAQRLGTSPSALQFSNGEHGKPQLQDGRWHFNLSHSGSWLVLALCQQGPLGVDIELGKRRHSPLPLARRFYAKSEYEWLCALPENEQESAFYRLWSRKEAVLKAHGGGIAAGLEKVRFIPDEAWHLDNQLDEQHYEVQDWPFASGWLSLAAATTAVNGYRLDERLNCHPLTPMLFQTLSEESN
ncbi:4'-phosphopantetheinyl transferase superfamily protein [Aeromonas jandaei]|uniref:4'-phosphopantetheinyl transferase family protein n=1 Tax=Aeromonas jandaei TaxID=650 RepID=UPI0019202723|nr:4'-phosphopantetheinyl transferase superfamily protein [Aeromonas jandaei]MBL0609848.1 4'-phosphopantetheinyl transferase superfamily protein [Aeromonas jandaei]